MFLTPALFSLSATSLAQSPDVIISFFASANFSNSVWLIQEISVPSAILLLAAINILESKSTVFKTSFVPAWFLISWIIVSCPYRHLFSLLPKATLNDFKLSLIFSIPSSFANAIAPNALYALNKPINGTSNSSPLIFRTEYVLCKVISATYLISGVL